MDCKNVTCVLNRRSSDVDEGVEGARSLWNSSSLNV